MNNEPLPPAESTPAQDRATEALLREYARLESRDDDQFLAAIERRLAEEPQPDAAPVMARIAPPMRAQPAMRRRLMKIATLAAAACLLATVSWYLGYTSKEVQPVVIVPHALPASVAELEAKPSAPAPMKAQPVVDGTRTLQTSSAPGDLSHGTASVKPLVIADTSSQLKASATNAPRLDIAGLTGLSDVNLRNELGLVSEGSERLGHDELLRGIAMQTPGTTLNDLTPAGPSIDRGAGGFAMTGTLKFDDRAAHSFDLHGDDDQTITSSLAGAKGVFQKGSAFGVFGGAILPSKDANNAYRDLNEPISTLSRLEFSTLSGVISGAGPSGPVAMENESFLSATSSSLVPSSANTFTGRTTITSGGLIASTKAASPLPSAAPVPATSPAIGRVFGRGTSARGAPSSAGGVVTDSGTLTFGNTGTVIGTKTPSLVNATVSGSGGIERSGAANWKLQSSAIAGNDVQFESRVTLAPGVPSPTTPVDKVSSGNRYEAEPVNPFLAVQAQPLSTFSIDVDTASYANIRRLIQSGASVPPAAVRLEEMINYFPYTYVEPTGEHPFSVKVESAACPWAPSHRLVKIALKAKEIDRTKRASANLVFLVDVSGSMSSEDKLALVIKNLRILTSALNADDTVSIVTYAGHSGVALPPTHGDHKKVILDKLASLSAGGSTNGAGGIMQAYELAKRQFIKEGVNRVVLCTDGDFNVGITGKQSLVELVKERAQDGIFLTVCGYGQGNLNDAMLESITNKGNGIYHYIDSEREGRKVFQDELFGTLVTVAKDVKLQVEFNPAQAAQYRLIGYDNRMLAKEDFANDKVDAGDMGAGHRVTALYEVIPTAIAGASSIPLKYQSSDPAPEPAKPASPELLTVKLRYKEPVEKTSKLFEQPFTEDAKAKPTIDFAFASVVAEFGNWLRGERAEGRSLAQLIEAAEAARGEDPHGYRAEFVELMKRAK